MPEEYLLAIGSKCLDAAAFGLMRHALEERMKRRHVTVLDATSVTPRERGTYAEVAHRHDVPCIVVAFDLPLAVCQQRSRQRRERPVPADVVERQHRTFERHLPGLHREPFDEVVVVSSAEELDAAGSPGFPTHAPSPPRRSRGCPRP